MARIDGKLIYPRQPTLQLQGWRIAALTTATSFYGLMAAMFLLFAIGNGTAIYIAGMGFLNALLLGWIEMKMEKRADLELTWEDEWYAGPTREKGAAQAAQH